MRVDGIETEDELRKTQAATQAQGTQIANYSEWQEILQKFEEYGIESTGSYEGDKAQMNEIHAIMAEYVTQLQEQEKIQQYAPKNNETEKVQEASKTDSEQNLKATLANGTSSIIMADYMKYYHLLM